MTSSMSDLRDGFNAFRLRQDKEALRAALKGEVGFVQGVRRRVSRDEALDLEDESPVENSVGGVIKMKGRIVIRKNERKKLKKKLESGRSSPGFCFETELSSFYEWGNSSCDFSVWNKLLPRQTNYFKKKMRRIRQQTLLTRRLRGGTGGSKPPDERRHTTFDLGKRSTLGGGPGLTPSDHHFDKIFHSTTPSTINVHNENTRKRASSFHHDHESEHHHHPGDPKKSKMSLSIRHYTMAGKMNKSRVSVASTFVHPREKKSRLSISTMSSISTNISSISSRSNWKVPMTLKIPDIHQSASTSQISSTSSFPRKPERKSEVPSIEPENVTARRASAELKAGPGLLISSVSQITAMTNAERDSEWLEWTSSDDDFDEDQEEPASEENKSGSESRLPSKKKRKGINVERSIQPELAAFLNSIKVLDKMGTWMGLSPYSKVVRGNHCVQVKWVPMSLPFIAVLVNTIFFFVIAFGTSSSLLFIYGLREPLPISKKILKIDFANHFTETLFVAIIALFLFIYCVSSVMEQGVHFAEFMCRFNMGVFLTRYDVTEGVHNMIVRVLGVTGAVLGFCFILFFSRTTYADLRENCGFLGLMVLRPFDFDLRESTYFPMVEMFGLVVFLHCLISIIVVLLQFMVYAKGVSNMAKIFNLRLIYLFGESSKQLADGTWGQVKKHIPLEKLQAEHLIVASLIRNLSHASVVYFGAFFLSIVLELVLSVWLFFDLFLSSDDQPNTEGLPESKKGTVDLDVPLRVELVKEETIIATLAMLGVTWLTYWLFGGVVHHAGENLMIATEYVRRHGLLLCSNSKERRFILSMINSFAPKNPYWLGKGFAFNRPFLVGLLGFVVGASMVTVSFRPDRVDLKTYTICNERGECAKILAAKTAESQFYRFFTPTKPPLPTYPPGVIPGLQEILEKQDFKYNSSLYIHNPPCLSGGSYPSTLTISCRTKWDGGRTPSRLQLPIVYKAYTVVDANLTTQYNYYGAIEDMFLSEERGIFSKCRTTIFATNNFPYTNVSDVDPKAPPVDCCGNVIDPNKTDDCGHLPFPTTDFEKGIRVDAKLKPVYVPNLPGLTSMESIVCCFEYGGYPGSKIQAEVCNQPDAPAFKTFCDTGAGRNRLQPGNIKQHYHNILRRIRYQNDVVGHSIEYIEKNEDAIRGCLCKLEDPQVAPLSEEDCACAGLQIPPCSSGYFTGILEEYALTCGPVNVPFLFKSDNDSSLIFPVEHERYRAYCKESSFSDRYSHKDDLEYNYPCQFPRSPPVERLHLTDCAGNRIEKLKKDDCSNWNFQMPVQQSNGVMRPPILRVKAYNYSVSQRVFVTNETMELKRAFVCCYQYEGKAFQTREQTQFCNAPQLEDLNRNEWCGEVVKRKNGVRDSTPFEPFLHDQLHRKLVLSLRYWEVKRRFNWLEKNDGPWTRCICANKLVEGNYSIYYVAWVKECIPLIVKPVRATDAKVINPFPPCPHKWPTYPQKSIITPYIFTFVNEIWESFERHRKISDPSETNECHIDESYEEVYKNDGKPLLHDLLLKPLPIGETDDCFKIPLRTFKDDGGLPLQTPTIRLAPEYTMAKYDEPPFKQTMRVHCCYSFTSFPKEQRHICNLPNAASVIKRCNNKTRSERRILHEFQLTRGLAVFETGAYFLGDQVKKLEDFSLNINSTAWEDRWRQCICNDTSSSDDIHKTCTERYLPPCIKSKGPVSSDIVKFEQMVTECPSQWDDGTTAINIPIIMESIGDGNFRQVPLYLEGSTPKKCPSIDTLVIQNKGVLLTDCYGQTIPTFEPLDDCKNPPIATVDRDNITNRVNATLQLVPASQWKELESSTNPNKTDDVLCCYNYGTSNASDLRVCHMPSFAAANKHCEVQQRNENFTKYLEKLVERRRRGIDVIAEDIPFDNAARAAWTQCLCYANLTECEVALKIGAFLCFSQKGPREDKMFTKCKENWAGLGFIRYPTILQKFDETEYRQVMPLGKTGCQVVAPSKPFPRDTLWKMPPLPVYDCNMKEYNGVHYDDCGTPIIPLDGSGRNLGLRLATQFYASRRALSCVVDLGLGLQVVWYNMPTQSHYQKCRQAPGVPPEFAQAYTSAAFSGEFNSLITSSGSITCICYHLSYVPHKYGGRPSAQRCVSHFDSYG